MTDVTKNGIVRILNSEMEGVVVQVLDVHHLMGSDRVGMTVSDGILKHEKYTCIFLSLIVRLIF